MQSLKKEHCEQVETVVTNGLKPKCRAQVVVVGAGLAGLAAAQRLHDAGIRDVIILDAQNRIGGRVHTIDHGDYILELGAQWLHGADDNPLYKWMLEKNMLDDFEDASLGFQGLFCTDSGHEVDQRLVKKVLDIVNEAKMSLFNNNCAEMMTHYALKNASQVFKHQLDVKVAVDEELQRSKSLVYAIFDWFLRYETIENGCNSMDEVSITSYTDWTDWGNGTLLNFKHGYRSLLHWFCSNMPTNQWIYLNKEVVTVETLKLRHDGGYCSCDKGNEQVYNKPMLVGYVDNRNKKSETDKEQGFIECDHVVMTVSLGYLKKVHETLFKPRLSVCKENIIESIGFGTVNKIILQFESPFCKSDHGIKLIWDGSEHTNDFPVWVRDIVAFDSVRKQPDLLIGWIGGQGARLMEQESDEDIAAICQRILERFLPARVRPTRIVSCICSRWNSNPFVCGSYSFQSMKSYDQKVDKLYEPLYSSETGMVNNSVLRTSSRVPRVLFAGEATAGKLYSTTHGAIISGWREADRLKNHLLSGEKANIQRMNQSSDMKIYN